MSSNDRLTDLKAGGAFLAWNMGKFPLTCTVMFAQAFCYAALRLSETGRLPIFVQNWFWPIYENAALSLDAMQEHRYYTLATSVLFMSDLFELAVTWTGLWFILSYVEYAFGKIWTLLVLLLPCVAANATFLLVSAWHVAEFSGSAAGWQVELLDLCRSERDVNMLPWRPAPLWLGIGTFAMVRLPWVRVMGRAMPIWCFVIALAAFEFTVIQSWHGQFYTMDTLVVTVLAGSVLGCVSWAWHIWKSRTGDMRQKQRTMQGALQRAR